jgi:hypothetical protein
MSALGPSLAAQPSAIHDGETYILMAESYKQNVIAPSSFFSMPSMRLLLPAKLSNG